LSQKREIPVDLLNEIYTILGIIASSIAIGTAIFAAVRIGKKLYTSSKQKKTLPFMFPIRSRGKISQRRS